MNVSLHHPRITAGRTLTAPFNRLDALTDLRQLGHVLDAQAIGGATDAELDATLSVMGEVHERIAAHLRSNPGQVVQLRRVSLRARVDQSYRFFDAAA
ncbi:hypothetical protein C7C46_16095 [Streptomyces tateyamensis]|uniref:Uncharacterized protein n=1 Tax=Streptomyces tateyamensis TaxID=565073 RepID=A0A2V4N6J6_9ACTN|nr:hypothetical protein [Streptomyces tateyamensis]PYC78619.1 hypothetical protein C7C46_16095 [Streptomyces tateyamensis]